MRADGTFPTRFVGARPLNQRIRSRVAFYARKSVSARFAPEGEETDMANDGFYMYQLRLFREMHVVASLFIDPQNPDM